MSVFFLSCKFGDAVSQTAQAYLPACFDFGDSNKTDHDKGGDTQDAVAEGGRTEGAAAEADEMGGLPWTRPAPPARARRLSSRLLRLSVVLGAFISAVAYTFATRLPTLFTRDAAVLAADEVASHGYSASLSLQLPPLSVLVLRLA